MNYNPKAKVKKYIVVGRKSTVINLDPDGEDKTTFSTEVFKLKPNTQMSGLFYEYERGYYRDGRRGTDCGLEEGKIYPCFDGTIQDFLDLNFKSDVNVTYDVRIVKTYTNKNFMKRDRKISYHEEWNFKVDVDDDGNATVKKKVTKNTAQGNPVQQAPTPATPHVQVKADPATIPKGVKYLYNYANTEDGECISVTDVAYWLANSAQNDQMLPAMSTSLDKICGTNWGELMENVLEANDGNYVGMLTQLAKDPEWGADPLFDAFLANCGI